MRISAPSRMTVQEDASMPLIASMTLAVWRSAGGHGKPRDDSHQSTHRQRNRPQTPLRHSVAIICTLEVGGAAREDHDAVKDDSEIEVERLRLVQPIGDVAQDPEQRTMKEIEPSSQQGRAPQEVAERRQLLMRTRRRGAEP